MTRLFEEISPETAGRHPGPQDHRHGQRRRRGRPMVEPRLLLAHLLRQGFKLTGTHIGCDTTNCGACTVLFDGQPVKSCTMFAVQADGHEVMTVEGLAGPSELHAIQEGFKEEHGLQCGFCTPGMMMTSKALLESEPEPNRGRDPLGAERQPLSLHRLSEHRQGGHVGRRRSWTARSGETAEVVR